jgi:hypothetical protein
MAQRLAHAAARADRMPSALAAQMKREARALSLAGRFVEAGHLESAIQRLEELRNALPRAIDASASAALTGQLARLLKDI